MKGLLLNNFYAMLSNLKLTLGISAVLTLVPIFIREDSFVSTIIGVQIFLFAVYTGTFLQADESSKWGKFAITLPVKRRTIIHAKYVSSILLIAVGLIISTPTAVLSSILIGDINPDSIVFGYCFGLTLSFSTVAFMYPILLKIGAEKHELVLILACGFSVGIMLLVSLILSLFKDGINFRSSIVGITSVVVSVLLLVLSYFISVRMHGSKEY